MTTTKRVRSAVARGISGQRFKVQIPGSTPAAVLDVPRVDRAAGIIRGASAIQAVEAIGHRVMIDEIALQAIVDLGNSGVAGGGHGPATAGVKVRFTHPGLCSDGMGKLLGRMRNFRIEGDKAVGDIYLGNAAANSPEGDLRSYVLQLAEEDPEAFGMSIVFQGDHVWKTLAGEEVPVAYDDEGEQVPPPEDVDGELPFLRPFALHAVDVVDEAAANRDGLFGLSVQAGLAAFSGTSGTAATAAFAQLDQLREQLGLTLDQSESFLARYFAARRSTNQPGAKPEPTEGLSMAMTPARLAELTKANPTHAQHIIDRFAAAADEATIISELGALSLAAARADIARLQTELGAEQVKTKAEADKAIAATAALAAAEEKLAKLTAVADAPLDPGPGDTPGATGKVVKASKADIQGGKFTTDDVLNGRVELAEPAVAGA